MNASRSHQSAQLTGQGIATEQGMVTLKIKTSLSVYLASSGALFARNAHAVEQKYASAPSEALLMEHRSYCIGAVIVSAAFLEAAINELYLEAIDRNPNTFEAKHQRLAELMEHVWETIEEHAILAKYQIALTLGEKPPFPKGEEPYQAVDTLIRLRNALVHYKPEWDTELAEHRKLEERLGNRFNLNPLVASNKAFIPHRCLGHGCAAWSISIAIDFYHKFRDRLGLPPHTISDPAGLAVR